MPEGHDSFLSMFQLCDSMFPTGAFAISNGIESMYASGHIRTAADIECLNAMYVEQQVGPTDCVAAIFAYDMAKQDDVDGIVRLDEMFQSQRPVRESRDASSRSGTQLCRCVAKFQEKTVMLGKYLEAIKKKRASGAHPVSFGICCQSLGIAREVVPQMLLYNFVAGNVGAALRLGIIDHYEAQVVIHNLKPIMYRAAQRSCSTDIMWQFCPQAEIVQMSHEVLDSKMFIT